MGAILLPSQRRGDVQIDPYTARITEVSVDAIVGCDLRQRARTARPVLSLRIDLASLEVIVRVVEGAPVGLQRLRTQNGVVHYALHTIAIARVVGHAEQVARQLEVRVRATRCLKATVALSKADGNIRTVRRTQHFIWPPASYSKTLTREHLKSVPGRAQVFLTS